MPTMYMLIGVPCSGKTTFVKSFVGNDMEILSRDDCVDKYAFERGKSYDEVFKESSKYVDAVVEKHLQFILTNRRDFIWDQTNLTRKSRAKKLRCVGKDYHKVAIFFEKPHPKVLEVRLKSRPGKTIPENVMKDMISNVYPPMLDEGFDEVHQIISKLAVEEYLSYNGRDI